VPEVYGRDTLDDINRNLERIAQKLGLTLDFIQSSHEGALVDAIHRAGFEFDGGILNAGAYSHTSLALYDAIKSITKPIVEVHLSNPHARESFRHHSYISGAVAGVIAGFGKRSYELALRWFSDPL
jgi:3-dehydroquinate dehydratase-2